MEEQIVDTWRIHNRINLFVLDAIADGGLDDSAVQKGRTVGEQIAHLHNVRLMWLHTAAPSPMSGLTKIEKAQAHERPQLRSALEASGDAVATMLANAIASGGRVKGFKPHAVAFMGYLIAHEAHHRGQIILRLKASGHPIDKKSLY